MNVDRTRTVSPAPFRRASAVLASCALAAWLAAGLPGGLDGRAASAQQASGIAAVVNDEVVTSYDLQQRLDLIIRSSSLPDTAQLRRELTPRVVNSLVEETLQLQEARRLNIRVARKEVDGALALLERQNRMPPGGLDAFLKAERIDRRTLIQQIEANLAWTDVIRQRFLHTIAITDEEIDRTVERIKDNADDPRLLLAEIFVAVDSPRDEAEARNNATRIFDQLRDGASFPQLARQFSQSSSAERGGDLGWIVPAELEPEVQKAVKDLPRNAVTEPIRTASGYYIVALRDRREPSSRGGGDTVVSLRQVVLPAAGAGGGGRSQQELADTIRQSVRGCEDFLGITKELGAEMSGDLGRLKLSELPPEVRKVVAGLDIGVPSPPLAADDSVRILMVCDRQEPTLNLPSRDEVRQRLVIQRLEVRARRYMRELRDAAFLDIRAS